MYEYVQSYRVHSTRLFIFFSGTKMEASWNATVSHAVIEASNPYLARAYPYMPNDPRFSTSDIDRFVDQLMDYRGDCCWSDCFAPAWLAKLMQCGFLPIATPCEPNKTVVLLPKLHSERCLMDPRAVHASKTVRKRSRRFTLSVDQAWDEVVARCVEQHGENWLFPIMQRAFKALHVPAGKGGSTESAAAASAAAGGRRVRLHSFELWSDTETDDDDATAGGARPDAAAAATTPGSKRKLVAGEIGYTVGKVYTSLTGFSHRDASSAGSVQLLATARVLDGNGFAMWDLGMGMDYKLGMGARNVARPDFVKQLRKHRGAPRLGESASSSGSSSSSSGSGSEGAAPTLALPGGAAFVNAHDVVAWERSTAVRLDSMRAAKKQTQKQASKSGKGTRAKKK